MTTPLTKCPNCQNPICTLGGNRFCGACGFEYPLGTAFDLTMQAIENSDAVGSEGSILSNIRKCTNDLHALQVIFINQAREKIPNWNERFCSKCGKRLVED